MSPQDHQDTAAGDGSKSPRTRSTTAKGSFGRPTGTAPAWLLVTKWLLVGLVLLVLAIVVQKLIEQGLWVGVVIAAFVAMVILKAAPTTRSANRPQRRDWR